MMTDNITVTITTPSVREAVVTREFNAPAALLFDAVTRADLIKRWYAAGGTIDACESDPRPVVGDGRLSLLNARIGQANGARPITRDCVQISATFDDDCRGRGR